MIKAGFSALLLQSSVSHDPSEITLIWWLSTFMIMIIIACFCGNRDAFFQDSLMNRKFKRTEFIW